MQRIAGDIKNFDFFQRYDLLRKVAEHAKLPQDFVAVYPEGQKFHGVLNVGTIISREHYPYWILGIFHRSRELLRKFLSLKAEVSGKILMGDAVDALKSIASISQLSECWWSIESAIHVNKELLGNDTKGYIKQLQETYPDINIGGIAKDLLLLSESNSANIYVEAVLSRIKEYKSSGITSAIQHGAVESCLLLPLYYDPDRTIGFEALYDYRTWSIFDQYVAFRAICMEMATCGSLSSVWANEAKILAANVGDWELLNTCTQDATLDVFVKNIIEQYTHGEYPTVINEVQSAIAEGSPKIFGLLEIYARAKIYTSGIGVGTSFFDKIADEFARILVLDAKSSERAEYIRKIAVKFRGESWAKSLFYHLVSMQEWRGDSVTIEQLRKQTICLGSFNTPKAQHRQFKLDSVSEGDRRLIPRHRVLRYSTLPNTPMIVDSSEFPIYSDYLKTQSLYFIEKGFIPEALDFSIREYLKNKVAFDYLPIRQLCEHIEHCDRDDTFDYISSLIILDIYGKESGGHFDEKKTDLFEEFLHANGAHQPSKIFGASNIDQKVSYILRNLCVPAQLDNIVQFSSYDEVIHERVAIIDLLISARAGNTEELRAEKDKVLETLFSEKLRAKIETGKLYVDVQALENDRRHVYIGLYEQAKSLEGGVSLDPVLNDGGSIDSRDLLQINSTSPVTLAVASSEKSGILVKIFKQAVKDFALNENYGLDKYLSAEVRHIVFVTQLRSCFEKLKLVTVQKNGEYLPNEFWRQNYNYVVPSVLSDVDIALAEFSHDVDIILAKVNDRFRVKVAEISSDNIFDFCAYHSRIVRISEILNSSESFDMFFNMLIGFMWELAVESARAAQQLINDVLLVDVLTAIDKLEAAVYNLKGNVPMLDLMQAIRNARSDFKKEVELVLNWFRFVGSEDVQTFERLGVVVEAAVSSFQAVFQHKGKVLAATLGRTELLLSYSEARSLFISLFTALENALRYGSSDTPVRISHNVYNNVDQVLISNQIEVEVEDSVEFVNSIKSKWTEEYSSLSTAEGGSGLYKIYNLLKNASAGFHFDITLTDSTFNAIINLNHEDFTGRG